MHKVSFFKSIHVKLVLIYILLIVIAIQVIGIYFSKELEESLKENFEESISQRIDLVEYSIREEFLKERDETMPTLGESLSSILREFSSGDINEIRVIDSSNAILATSDSNNQSLIGQKSNEDIVSQAIYTQTPSDIIALDQDSLNRVWVLATPILEGPNGEVMGAIILKQILKKSLSN